MAAPPVSVIVPTYDRPTMLLEALESVATQTHQPSELLVVDDASPEPVAPLLEANAPGNLEWRCIRHEENQGANAARNTGIRHASGSILAFLDDDDTWRPAKLERQVERFREDPEVGVVLVGQQFVDGDGVETGVRLPSVGRQATSGLVGTEVGGTFSTIAVRRSLVDTAGLPDERFPAWQDREWLVRLSRHAPFATVREPLVVRRHGEHEQIGDAFEAKRDISYPLFLEKHGSLAKEYGCERLFRARLAAAIAGAGLANGHYGDARRFALKAIRTQPVLSTPYLYLAVALGGPYGHWGARKLNRALGSLTGRSAPNPARALARLLAPDSRSRSEK